MSEGYGYSNRPDIPDRFAQGSVAMPRNQWPRSIRGGLGGEGGYPKVALQLLSAENTIINGFGTPCSESTTNGTLATATNSWWSDIGRTGRLLTLTGTGGQGRTKSDIRIDLSPIGLLGFSTQYAPWSVVLADVVAAASTTMPASGTGGASFGLSNYSLTPPAVPPNAFIGFTSNWSDPATYGAWSTWIASTGGGFTRAYNTGFATNEPHLLEVEFDGVNRLINFHIDGEMVDSYSPASSDLFTHLTYNSNICWEVYSSNGCVTRIAQLCDMVPNISVTLTDLDG